MKRGFTVVELMVVVAVIVVLATVVAVGYQVARDNSRDSTRRAAAQQVEQAINTLRLHRDSRLLMGGYGSTLTADASGFCQHSSTYAYTSSTAANWVFYSGTDTTNYGCTTGSMLLGTKVLSSDFVDRLPENEEYTVAARKKDAAMVIYRCDTTNTRWMLFYYVRNQTSDEAASMTSALNDCPSISSTVHSQLVNTLKMRGAIEIKL
ncbi:hypothetical protein B7Z00_03795 [Candidatus Saccharibacteria bacterium 32-50-10]|nr:MAG: hypothetical protein B7Z00_03795 [Candidatus Saccharibacteria bacterium 32-50-10]